ncbi:MAG: hypothetical protein EZS28_043266 [Streblomastix strix]|uniref:Uncharacterized protein n=1 Tax=Streblomastix strix TaxID=222440 RepID=A0A5J4TSJ9_9EUKA|nr:MAG: hypothetical protein EZS28_043266 [Streblomastix strix]
MINNNSNNNKNNNNLNQLQLNKRLNKKIPPLISIQLQSPLKQTNQINNTIIADPFSLALNNKSANKIPSLDTQVSQNNQSNQNNQNLSNNPQLESTLFGNGNNLVQVNNKLLTMAGYGGLTQTGSQEWRIVDADEAEDYVEEQDQNQQQEKDNNKTQQSYEYECNQEDAQKHITEIERVLSQPGKEFIDKRNKSNISGSSEGEDQDDDEEEQEEDDNANKAGYDEDADSADNMIIFSMEDNQKNEKADVNQEQFIDNKDKVGDKRIQQKENIEQSEQQKELNQGNLGNTPENDPEYAEMLNQMKGLVISDESSHKEEQESQSESECEKSGEESGVDLLELEELLMKKDDSDDDNDDSNNVVNIICLFGW